MGLGSLTGTDSQRSAYCLGGLGGPAPQAPHGVSGFDGVGRRHCGMSMARYRYGVGRRLVACHVGELAWDAAGGVGVGAVRVVYHTYGWRLM